MATTTITTTAPEDARIVVAFGTYLGLGRNATQAEVKSAISAFVAAIVRDQEKAAAALTASQNAAISPT